MDGNGRWAKQYNKPRFHGHEKGVDTAKAMIRAVAERDIPYLTLFAFSSENWHRPAAEVRMLFKLFHDSLLRGIDELVANGVRLRFIGDFSQVDAPIRKLMQESEAKTQSGDTITVHIAVSYGGRWDIIQALGALRSAEGSVDEPMLAAKLMTAGAPDPDLLIRSGGERRISNFMLWQLAYAELYFTDVLWPDFDAAQLDIAIDDYHQRQRRFGRV